MVGFLLSPLLEELIVRSYLELSRCFLGACGPLARMLVVLAAWFGELGEGGLVCW